MSRFTTHMLLVEGEQDKRVIPYLLDAHIVWGDNKSEFPTNIEAYGGVDDLLAEGEIETQLKTPKLQALGIIVDANDSLDSRWQQVRNRCLTAFPELSETLPRKGLIAINDDGIRLDHAGQSNLRNVGDILVAADSRWRRRALGLHRSTP